MPFSGSSTQTPRLAAAMVAISYLVAGLIWIAFSDEFGAILFSGAAVHRFQTYKGAAFVVATAALIFFLLDRRYRRMAPVTASPSSVPLGVALAGLVLLTAAPMVILLGYNITSDLRRGVANADRLVIATAEDKAQDVQSYFDERRKTISMLGEHPAVVAGDRAGCETLLSTILGLYKAVRSIEVHAASNAIVCAAGDPALIDRHPQDLTARAGPLVGRPFRPSPASDWYVPVTYPTNVDDASAGVRVQVVMSPQALAALMRSPLPEGGSVTLVQSDGFILARDPDSVLVGTRVRDLAMFDQMKRGLTRTVGPDGVEREYAVRAVPGMGLFVVAGVAVESFYRPIRSSALRYLGVGLAVVLIAGVLIARVVGSINGPMQAMALAAQRVGDGDFSEPVPEAGPLEFRRVAARFNDMMARLPLMERELRESEERHRTLLDKLSRNIPGMLFQFRVAPDGTAEIPFASHGIHRMFEASPADAQADARRVLERIHPDDSPAVAASIEASKLSLGYLSMEFRVVLPVHGLRHYLTHSQPERLEDGSVLWHGCTVDITQLKLARDALQRLNEDLERRVQRRTGELAAANGALESFSYSIAHDLRAPLAAISGFAEALVSDPHSERAPHMAGRIVANAARMEDMIQGLLALAGVGRAALKDAPIDMEKMVRDIVDEDPATHAAVEVQSLPRVLGDAKTMRQVWQNLIGNAVKFTSAQPRPRIVVGAVRTADAIEFFVEDNGAGFDPAQAHRLFNVFERMHTVAEFPGTGVGLAIVKRIVERHGGRIRAEGEPGRGATFTFALPLERLAP